MASDIERELALIQETNTAVGLAKLGLGSLQVIGGDNDFYLLPLQLLASAYERLLKVILAIHHKQKCGAYPTQSEFKKYGHEITKLLDAVTKDIVFGGAWITVPAGASDHAFLKSNSLHRELVAVLSHFGSFGRYSDLDIVAGKDCQSTPESDWKRIELTILTKDDLDILGTSDGLEYARNKINKAIVTNFEIAFRALCRWFTIGGGSELGRQKSGNLTQFLKIQDSTLGQTKWLNI
jgi:hypothetical protein